MKSYLKWAGGKTWLIPHLRPLWAQHQQRELWDLFCGSLAVGLHLGAQRALCNDANRHLQNLHAHVRNGLRNDLDIQMENSEAVYYANRTRFNVANADPSRERESALLFYYLNRTGFNGLCRFNRRGEYNVPFGRYKTINYIDDFSEYQEAMRDWTFRVGDFEWLEPPADAFVYADPPYAATDFTAYDGNPFTWGDQLRLLAFLRRHPGPVVASNKAVPTLVERYVAADFVVQIHSAPRRISCTGDRTPELEMLAWRNI